MATSEHIPFYYLNRLINVLIIDNDPKYISEYQNIFKKINVFNVLKSSSTQQAETIITSPDRIHLCICDFGMNSEEEEDFYLIKKYAARIPFVVATGSVSPKKGFLAHAYGAKDIAEKGDDFKMFSLIKMVIKHSLLNIINPKYKPNSDSLSLSTEILFLKNPDLVSKWAKLMNITDRSLRYIWKNNLGANAKIILSIFHMFNDAFTYYEKFLHGTHPKTKVLLKSNTYKRLEEFFHMHKSSITDFIQYGDIAAHLTEQ